MTASDLLVSRDETIRLCGRQYVETRQQALHALLLRSFASEPRHSHVPNAIALSFRSLRTRFGNRGRHTVLTAFFVKVANHCSEKWTAAYKLNDKTATLVEQHLLQVDPLTRHPFHATMRPVGQSGLRFPDSIPVNLAHLQAEIERVHGAIMTYGPECSPFLGSAQSLHTVYSQLLAIRNTVITTGGLPNKYERTPNGRFHGVDDHHPLTLTRTTRHLALGNRNDLWDADLSNAHLVIAQGLSQSWHPEIKLRALPAYLRDRDEWIAELLRRLKDHGATTLSYDDVKVAPRAWLYGSRRTRRGSSSAVIKSPEFEVVLNETPMWSLLHQELRDVGQAVLSHSSLTIGKPNTRLSYLLSEWETKLMERVMLKVVEGGLSLQAWLYDGMLLVQEHNNPTRLLDEAVAAVQQELQTEGFRFDSLALSVRSMSSLYHEVTACLA